MYVGARNLGHLQEETVVLITDPAPSPPFPFPPHPFLSPSFAFLSFTFLRLCGLLSLELTILLPQTRKSWDFRHVQPYLANLNSWRRFIDV